MTTIASSGHQPTQNGEPKGNFGNIELPEDPYKKTGECDLALGSYMRGWDRLDMALFFLFHKLLGTYIPTANVIYHSGIDPRRMREIIKALGKLRLSGNDNRDLTDLLDRAKKATSKRNHIIHGSWMLDVEMRGPKGQTKAHSTRWVRHYQPSDPTASHEMFTNKNQKLLSAYRFTPQQLIEAGNAAVFLATHIEAFTKSTILKQINDPQRIGF